MLLVFIGKSGEARSCLVLKCDTPSGLADQNQINFVGRQ